MFFLFSNSLEGAYAMSGDRNADTLALLRRQVERIERRHGGARDTAPRLTTGLSAVDDHLGGGLTTGAIHEVLSNGADTLNTARSTRFVASVLGRTRGQVAWIGCQTLDIHAAGLRQLGLNPGRLICIELPDADIAAVTEDALREPGLVAVVSDLTTPLTLTASRRLVLAAERSGVTGFLLPRMPLSALPPSAAASRWQITSPPRSPARPDTPVLDSTGLCRLDLLRLRGGLPAQWDLEVAYAPPYSLALAPVLADRTATTNILPWVGRRSAPDRASA